MNKKLFYTVCLFCSVLAGWNLPLCAAEPVAQYTLRFEGKKQDDNNAVALSRITISNLSQGCDTTFTSTTFQLKVLAKPSGIETLQQASAMQARLVSSNPFTAMAEVEVTLPVAAPLRLTLFSTDGKIQQHYDGRFEAGVHRFNVEPAQWGVSFLSVSNGTGQQTLKLSKLGAGGNPARVEYAWSVNPALAGTPVELENALRAEGDKPFVYYEGDQLQMIGYAEGFANSSLYDTPAKSSDYTFLFSVPYYRIRGHQIATSRPSFVDVLFSVEDLNRNGVDNLLSDDFIIKENGVSVGGTSESFAYIRKMSTVPYKIQTVLVLDNSRSLSLSDLDKMKAAAIKLIESKENYQEIAVYSFSEEVNLLQNFTTDKVLLTQAVNSIQRGGSSTNLYGAYITGVHQFTDLFSTEQINQGFMVVFTDGDDTQASHTLSEAIYARVGKRVYMVGLGNLDAVTLNQLANPGPYSPVNSADELEQVFLSIQPAVYTQFCIGLNWKLNAQL